jgi:hypothetical protein
VKYRKALLAAEVVAIILETAEGITERYGIEFETIGCDKFYGRLRGSLCGTLSLLPLPSSFEREGIVERS